MAEANFFALVSHQYWGVWTLIQAHHSAVDFDYFTYGRLGLSAVACCPGCGRRIRDTPPSKAGAGTGVALPGGWLQALLYVEGCLLWSEFS